MLISMTALRVTMSVLVSTFSNEPQRLGAFHLFCQGELIRKACETSALFVGGLY